MLFGCYFQFSHPLQNLNTNNQNGFHPQENGYHENTQPLPPINGANYAQGKISGVELEGRITCVQELSLYQFLMCNHPLKNISRSVVIES